MDRCGPFCCAKMKTAGVWEAAQPFIAPGASSPALGMRRCVVRWMGGVGWLYDKFGSLPSACHRTSCLAYHHLHFYCRTSGRNWTPRPCTGTQQQLTSQQSTRAESKVTLSAYQEYRMYGRCNWQLRGREALQQHTWTYWRKASMIHTLVIATFLAHKRRSFAHVLYQPVTVFHAGLDTY